MESLKHRKGTLALLIVVLSFLVQEKALASNSALTYQGRILKSSGEPLSYGSVSFIFQITDPSGNCVLYKEQLDGIDMSKSGGLFDIGIGKGTVSYQAGSALSDIFKNGVSLNCQGTGTYTAAATDERLLKVQFYDGTSWNSITPAAPIRSVPTALNAVSADKLGANVASDFVLKTGIPTCTGGTVLSYDGTSFSCVAGGGGGGGTGTVTNVSSANSYITIANATTTPSITLNVGTTANTVAAGNDSRIVGAIQTGAAAGGDLSGTLPNPTVAKIQGVAVSNTAPATGNFLKYDGTKWVGAALSTSDVSGMGTYQTQAAFNTAVGSANCTSSQTPYWNSVSGSFQCQAINVGLVGDVTGSIGASVVSKLQGSTLTITTPTSGQYLKFDGSAFVNSALSASDLSGAIPAANMPAFTGDVTSSAGSTALSLAATGTAGTYYKVTTDSKGRVTAGAASLVAGDIPNLDWSKISTGLPTTLAGYGVTDAVKNGGGVGNISAGADASKPATPASGDLFVTTDTQKIYRYNGSSWDLVSSAGGTGGTITQVSPGTGLTGGGSSGAVTLNVDVGTGANKIVQLDATGKLPAVDGSQLTGLQASQIPSISAAKITSGVLAVAQGGTGQSTFSDGQLLIGDSSSNGLTKATLTAGSGISITNGNGSITIAASGGGGTVTNVTGTSPISVATGTSTPVVSLANGSAAGQVYRWDGTSAWAATKLKYTDLVNATSASPWPASSCTAGQAITWSSASDSFSCTSISIDGSQLTGTVAAAQMPAFTGDVTSSAGSTALNLANSGVTAGTYTSVTVDAKGRVTSGTSPTNLAGYGITDAVKNGGGVGNISAGLDASKPGSPASGDLFVATDTQKIYRYNGSVWDLVSSAGGTGGTVTNVTGTSPISVATGASTPVVSLANGTAAGQVFRWDGTSAWATTKLKYTDLVNATSASPWPASSCTAGQAITWSSASDSFSCATISLDGSQVTGTVAAAQMPAFTGDATSTAGSTALTLANSGVTAGTYTSVTVDAKGRVTSGTSPTTLSGYGITDSVKNAGGVGNISAGADASKPATPAAGDIYLATDTNKIYQYNSGAWVVFSSGSVSNNVTLTDGKIWVGNGSNSATEVNVSGDATLSNAGVLTLSNSGATAGTYSKVTVDAKGRVTSGASLAAGDITTALTFTPLNKAGDTMSGALNMGGNDISNSGNITMAANKYLTLSSNSSAGSTAGQMWYDATSNVIKYYNGSAVQTVGVSGSGLSSLNGLTANSQTFAIGTSGNSPAWNSATSTHTLNIPMASTASVTAGLLSNTDWNTFNNKVGTGTSFAGDVTGTIGATVVSQVGGVTAANVAAGANLANAVIGSTTTSDKTANSIVTQGQISSGSQTYSNSTSSIDWNNGNVIATNFDCGSAFSFSNMKDGGTYTLVVTGTGTTKCSFPSTVDSQAVTYYFKPTNSTRTASSMTAYTFMRVGNNILVSWASGFSSVGN